MLPSSWVAFAIVFSTPGRVGRLADPNTLGAGQVTEYERLQVVIDLPLLAIDKANCPLEAAEWACVPSSWCEDTGRGGRRVGVA